jgi:hypothetical protein
MNEFQNLNKLLKCCKRKIKKEKAKEKNSKDTRNLGRPIRPSTSIGGCAARGNDRIGWHIGFARSH